jgi:hypothetical protein
MNDLKFTTAGEYMKNDKCNTCGEKYSLACDWNQGRCPHHPPMLTSYHFRYYNLWQTIKEFFK